MPVGVPKDDRFVRRLGTSVAKPLRFGVGLASKVDPALVGVKAGSRLYPES